MVLSLMTYREVRAKMRSAAFLRQTPVILADEPSADLDEENVNREDSFQEEKNVVPLFCWQRMIRTLLSAPIPFIV